MAKRIDDKWLDSLRERWESAPHGTKGKVIDEAAREAGLTPVTVRRHLKGVVGHKRSMDRRVAVQPWVFEMWDDIDERARQIDPDGRSLPRDIIRRKLRERGVPEDMIPSDYAISAWQQDTGRNVERRYRRREAEFSLQVVQMDFSRSECFQYLVYDRSGDDCLLKVTKRSLAYKNKPADRSYRTWLVSCVDEYSRLGYAKMYGATGESPELAMMFLRSAWTQDETQRVFCHAPHALQLDRGSAGRSKIFRSAVEGVGVEIRIAKEKTSQGKVENRFRHIWRNFELDLAERLGSGATIHMKDYNAELEDWCIREGRTRKHPMLNTMSREDAYLASLRMYPPISVDTDLFRYAFTVHEATVNQYGLIRFEGEEWDVPTDVRDEAGRKVRIPTGTRLRVLRNMKGQVIASLVESHVPYFKLMPWEQPYLGDFSHGPKATRTEEIQARINVHESGPEAARKYIEQHVAPVGEKRPKVHTLPHRSIDVKPAGPFAAQAPVAPAVLSETDARALAGRRLQGAGFTYADFQDLLDPMVGSSTQEDLHAELDRLIHQSTQTGTL